MKQAATTRCKFIAGTGVCLFALAVVATSTPSMAASALLDFVEITEGITRLPLLDRRPQQMFNPGQVRPDLPAVHVTAVQP